MFSVLCCFSTKDPGQKPFTFTAGVGQVIAGVLLSLLVWFNLIMSFISVSAMVGACRLTFER